MTDERTNGSLRACEADATCHAPAVHRVNVLRPGWKVPESRQYCIMHAAQALPVDAPATTVTAYDAPVRRPLRAEVLAALASDPRHLSVIRGALTRPALPMTVRRELDVLIEEGLAVEGPPSHFARRSGITQEPPMSKTQPTQAERVLEDVRAHPWTSVGDVVRRTRDAKAAARLVEAVQAGRIVRIGEARRYRYAVPGTPIPGLTEPVSAADQLAPAVEESLDFGIADPPGPTERRPTLAERLARAVGVDLTGGDTAIVEAVERVVAERKELEERDALSLASEVERLRKANDDLRNAVENALDLAGACSDEDLIAAVRDAATTSALVREALQSSPFATPAEVTQQVIDLQPQPLADILATANASLREIGGGVAKRRVGCTVALGSGSAFFALSDEAARTLAPLLFQGVTVALLAPALSKPTPVVPEFPSAPTPDDDQDMPF